MTVDWIALIEDARAGLEEQQSGGVLGEVVELSFNEVFTGRYRGTAEVPTQFGGNTALLLWDNSGALRFMWGKAILQRELDEARPEIGDAIAIVRGEDLPPNPKYPDRSPAQRYVVRTRVYDAPLPDGTAQAKPIDDDIPF